MQRKVGRQGLLLLARRTVDGAQGAESDTVILSFVRSNANASIGFVEDWRRLNVAITRAKRALIMVGNARTIGAADVGDAPGDLLRHAAQTHAIYTCPSGYTSAEAAARADTSADATVDAGAIEALAATADELVSGASSTHAAKRGRAAPPAPPTVTDHVAVPPPAARPSPSSQSGGGRAAAVGSVAQRVIPARRSADGDDDAEVGPDPDVAYLEQRAAEIESFVAECRRADAAKLEKRQQEERAARAPFAPPPLYVEL